MKTFNPLQPKSHFMRKWMTSEINVTGTVENTLSVMGNLHDCMLYFHCFFDWLWSSASVIQTVPLQSRGDLLPDKSKVICILSKDEVLCINRNIDGVTRSSRSHTHLSHSQNLSPLILVPILRSEISPSPTQLSVWEVFRSLSFSF